MTALADPFVPMTLIGPHLQYGEPRFPISFQLPHFTINHLLQILASYYLQVRNVRGISWFSSLTDCISTLLFVFSSDLWYRHIYPVILICSSRVVPFLHMVLSAYLALSLSSYIVRRDDYDTAENDETSRIALTTCSSRRRPQSIAMGDLDGFSRYHLPFYHTITQ